MDTTDWIINADTLDHVSSTADEIVITHRDGWVQTRLTTDGDGKPVNNYIIPPGGTRPDPPAERSTFGRLLGPR